MARARLIAMLLASITTPALAGLNDAAHWSGGQCLTQFINNGLPGPQYQGVAFVWYQNIATSATQTLVESNFGHGVTVELFRNNSGGMQLHLYVEGTQNGINNVSQYMNIYSGLPLVTAANTPAYFLIAWDSSSGNVLIDMNGANTGPDTSRSFVVGTPFTTDANHQNWTIGCHETASTGQGSQFLAGDTNQLWVDQSNDEYDSLTTPGSMEGAFVLRYINGPPDFLPLPLGFHGTGIFGIMHGYPTIFSQGSGGDGLFARNPWGTAFVPLTASGPSTTFNFPWSLGQ